MTNTYFTFCRSVSTSCWDQSVFDQRGSVSATKIGRDVGARIGLGRDERGGQRRLSERGAGREDGYAAKREFHCLAPEKLDPTRAIGDPPARSPVMLSRGGQR
jgi:hypothetical protein